jgi:fluoride ion exporter CrcB/FEX
MPTGKRMNVLDTIAQIPTTSIHQTALKAGGFVGGSTFVSGFVVDATLLSSAGQFMGGLAALATVIYSIYKGRRK